MKQKLRCSWCQGDSLYLDYHDNEWGVPLREDQKLFEFLLLEGAQAGLSWITILKKRESFRRAFDDFDANKIARYSNQKRLSLLQNPSIVRNKLKINAFTQNAQSYIKILEKYTSFSNYVWQFVDGTPVQNHWSKPEQIPTSTTQSQIMSKELKKAGFSFVGPTICYAFMQATGMVNDHTVDCFRHQEIQSLSNNF